MIKPLAFPEITSTQHNCELIRDRLNELIAAYNAKNPDPEPDNVFTVAQNRAKRSHHKKKVNN